VVSDLVPVRNDGEVTTFHDIHKHEFGSDNYAGVHPEVLTALAEANGGHRGGLRPRRLHRRGWAL